MANALLLGGGAPTLTLEAGALAALLERDVKFDAISTAGAGMLVGLLYVAPKGTSPRQALERRSSRCRTWSCSTYSHLRRSSASPPLPL
jgi:predicted acylesterase/phospholipase RssA